MKSRFYEWNKLQRIEKGTKIEIRFNKWKKGTKNYFKVQKKIEKSYKKNKMYRYLNWKKVQRIVKNYKTERKKIGRIGMEWRKYIQKWV